MSLLVPFSKRLMSCSLTITATKSDKWHITKVWLMRRKKMLPLAVLAVSAMFFTGNSLMASAVKLEDLSDPEPWVSTPLSHAEANALWKSEAPWF